MNDVPQAMELIWWITAFEGLALAGLSWAVLRNHQSAQDEIDDVRRAMEVGLAHLRQNMDAYKLDVAKSYGSIAFIKDVEWRLTGHLIRIEEKVTPASPERKGQNDE